MESMSEQRKTLSEALAFKYPDRVPVIIKKKLFGRWSNKYKIPAIFFKIIFIDI